MDKFRVCNKQTRSNRLSSLWRTQATLNLANFWSNVWLSWGDRRFEDVSFEKCVMVNEFFGILLLIKEFRHLPLVAGDHIFLPSHSRGFFLLNLVLIARCPHGFLVCGCRGPGCRLNRPLTYFLSIFLLPLFLSESSYFWNFLFLLKTKCVCVFR